MFYIFNLASILYIYFMQTNKINTSFQKMTDFVITKITKLYMPYVFMSVLVVVVSWIAHPFRFINESTYFFITVILFLLYFTWHKFYITELVTTKHL